MRTFKTCGSCRFAWTTWEDFVADRGVRLLGLQALAGVPGASVLVFEHRCGSSVSVLTRRLYHLVPAPDEAWPSLRGTAQCGRHCLSLTDHALCDRPCSHRRDRDILALVERLVSADGRKVDV